MRKVMRERVSDGVGCRHEWSRQERCLGGVVRRAGGVAFFAGLLPKSLTPAYIQSQWSFAQFRLPGSEKTLIRSIAAFGQVGSRPSSPPPISSSRSSLPFSPCPRPFSPSPQPSQQAGALRTGAERARLHGDLRRWDLLQVQL